VNETKVGQHISSDDACLLLNGWDESSALITCQAKIANTSFSMRGRMRDTQGGSKIKLVSDDEHGELSFALGPNCQVIYADSRDFPKDIKVVCSLFVFPSGAAEEGEDFIWLSEVEG